MRRVPITLGRRQPEVARPATPSPRGAPVRLRFEGPSPRRTPEQAALADVVALARSPLPDLTVEEEAALEPREAR